ncbi:MAG: DUF899 domain-containing protein [Acidimicrobiia bacterium]
MTAEPVVGTRDEWLRARLELLAAEKELTRRHDAVAEQRRALPWVRMDKHYEFETVDGTRSLADLFDGRSQLLVYHFMFGPEWAEGCPSCSFWADNFNGIDVHLAHRDVTFLAASRAPLDRLLEYRSRMGWSFTWVSSYGSDFNVDFHVSDVTTHNYREIAEPADEHAGLSAFAMRDDEVFHTYSCYARGLDGFNGAYQLLDLAPKGRDEADLPWTAAWLHRHDAYPDQAG